MPLYISCTTCHTTVPCSGSPVLCFPKFLCLCIHIPNTPQVLQLFWVLSTLPYILLLPLEAAPSLHNALSLSFTICIVVLLPLSFSLSFLDTPTSCVPFPHIQNISLPLLLSLVFSPPLLHTASLDSSMLWIYSLLSSLSFAFLYFCIFGQDVQTSHIVCTTSLLFLLILLLVWWVHAFD